MRGLELSEGDMTDRRTSEENRQQPTIFFVIPCYNEVAQLPITAPVLLDKITAMKSKHLISDDSHILLVDDGSEDGIRQYIRRLNDTDSSLFHGVKLAHNRGHQNALLAIYVIVSWASNNVVSGWGSIMCSLWLIGGLLMLSTGIIGEYMGKIYLAAKHRPRYVIEAEI